jgi:hypothetical protein
MAQTLETGLIINGLTGDANTLLISGPTPESVFVVRNSGNVGIGITNPTEKLEVSGKTKTETIQITSGVTNIGSVLTAVDSQGNTEWGQFINVTSLSATTPMSATNVNSPVISIQDAKADDITKGAASFNSSDFNDNNNGLISIDYVNAQKASGTTDGFLSSSDWNTFNNKQNGITLTTTGTSGPSTFDSITGNLNIPSYGGSSGAFGFSYIFGFGGNGVNGVQILSGRTYTFGDNFQGAGTPLVGGTPIIISGGSAVPDRPSRSICVNKNGNVVFANIIVGIAGSSFASPNTSTMQFLVHNVTTGVSSVIDPSFPIGGGLPNPVSNGWVTGSTFNPSISKIYTLSSPLSISEGDRIQIRLITTSWNVNPSPLIVFVTLFVE